MRAAHSLAQAAAQVDARAWSDALLAGCAGISELGGAQPGDRTMLDALQPAATAFAAALTAGQPAAPAWDAAVAAAASGSAATATMVARRGRSQYLVLWLSALQSAIGAPGAPMSPPV